jgi:hypothetical protein
MKMRDVAAFITSFAGFCISAYICFHDEWYYFVKYIFGQADKAPSDPLSARVAARHAHFIVTLYAGIFVGTIGSVLVLFDRDRIGKYIQLTALATFILAFFVFSDVAMLTTPPFRPFVILLALTFLLTWFQKRKATDVEADEA